MTATPRVRPASLPSLRVFRPSASPSNGEHEARHRKRELLVEVHDLVVRRVAQGALPGDLPVEVRDPHLRQAAIDATAAKHGSGRNRDRNRVLVRASVPPGSRPGPVNTAWPGAAPAGRVSRRGRSGAVPVSAVVTVGVTAGRPAVRCRPASRLASRRRARRRDVEDHSREALVEHAGLDVGLALLDEELQKVSTKGRLPSGTLRTIT